MTAGSGAQRTPPRPVVLYGREELARLACYCLTHDSSHEVAGFTVRHAEMPAAPEVGDSLLGLPLTPFEILEERFPPDRYDLLIAIGPHPVNGPRAARFEEADRKSVGWGRGVAVR